MQQLTIAGNVGKDGVLRDTANDKVLSFSVAVSNGKGKDSTWFDVAVWGKRAEALHQYITKGTRVAISGRPTCRAHDGKAYMGVNVDQLTFLGGGQAREEGSGDGYGAGGTPNNSDLADDEIPFLCEWRL